MASSQTPPCPQKCLLTLLLGNIQEVKGPGGC